MSRRLPSSHRRLPSVTDNNPYQGTTVPFNKYIHQPKQCQKELNHPKQPMVTHRGSYFNPLDTGLSEDDAFTDTTYYEYYQDHEGRRESRYTTYSEDSGSTRLPFFDYDQSSIKPSTRNSSGERSSTRRVHEHKVTHKDFRKVYPDHPEAGWERLYQEIPSPCTNPPVVVTPPRCLPTSRLSDRPQSSMSSGVTSAIVDGCGGKCQTFENVCYFFLQLMFTMGILIGISLCIAGTVLRKSAARNLQVLVYIGVLVAMVSGLLLGVQCNARNDAKKRKKALRNAKRAPIPLDTLNRNQQPLMAIQDGRRVIHVPHTNVQRPLPQIPPPPVEQTIDEQGVPWWRRKEVKV